MLASGAARLLSGFALSTCSLAAKPSSSSRAAAFGAALLRGCGAWTQNAGHLAPLAGAGPSTTLALAGFSAQAPGSSEPQPPSSSPPSPDLRESSAAPFPAAAAENAAAAAAATSEGPAPASYSSSTGAATDADAAAAAAPPSAGPASRRDKSAAAEVVYPSSRDDNLGVQRNWFNALFTQLQVVQRTGMAPHLKGRQKEVFEAVEREFEGLWERHIRGKGLEGTAHRGMLLCCLAVATHKVLLYETGDDALVREVVRTNLGGTAVGIMMRLHKARLWLLLRLLAEDPYKQAVRFLPSLQGDLGSLVAGEVAAGEGEATWTASGCAFHSVLAAEGATELLPEFCCQFSMQWLEVFSEYGVRVGLEESLGFGDERCTVRISRPGGGGGGGGASRPPGAGAGGGSS